MSKQRVAGCPTGWKESLDGDNWELTAWLWVTAWRKLAESVNQYLEKGSQVFVEGELVGEASDSSQSELVSCSVTMNASALGAARSARAAAPLWTCHTL